MDGSGTDPLSASAAAGHQRAFAALYDRFGTRLYRAAMGMLGRREDAEDTVQEVFVAVLQAQPRLTGAEDLTAYLFTALRRAAARCAARRARRPALSETAVDEAAVPAGGGVGCSNPYGERLQRALLALPAEQREVVALKIDGELTLAQIAQVMGVSINTAASRYRYALEKLRASLRGWPESGDQRSPLFREEGANERSSLPPG
jgi:RNA polymerase sigma-70 factor (ECF subfamily)